MSSSNIASEASSAGDAARAERIEHLYKEYVRLSDRADEYIKSSFDDFKLLGALGGLIVAWKPIAELLKASQPELARGALILFLGFLSLFLTVAVIAFRDLLKQALIFDLAGHLRQYEKELRKYFAEESDSTVFRLYTKRLDDWYAEVFRPTALRFHLVFSAGIVVVPVGSMFITDGGWWFAVAYLGLSVVTYGLYWEASKRIFGSCEHGS
jgi:hypothetical protein